MTNTLLYAVVYRCDVPEGNVKMNRIQVLLLTLCLPVWLTGCTGSEVRDEASPFYSVPADSMLTLNRALTIPANRVAVYMQNGNVLGYNDVDWYQPNCKFELYTMSEQSRTVSADSFRITRVVDEIESSSLQERVQYVSLVVGLGLDRSYVFNYATMMYLHSDVQPDVYRMTCQHWEDVVDDRYLSIEQMRQAMGEVFTLAIKKPDSAGQ
jgi:hypothetical protein